MLKENRQISIDTPALGCFCIMGPHRAYFCHKCLKDRKLGNVEVDDLPEG